MGFYRCVLGKSFVVVSCWALAPLAVCFAVFLTVRRKSGWGICVLPWFCWLVFLVCLICQASCDHQRPCRSFLTNCLVSYKDRALERDRPHRRKKKPTFIKPRRFMVNFLILLAYPNVRTEPQSDIVRNRGKKVFFSGQSWSTLRRRYLKPRSKVP